MNRPIRTGTAAGPPPPPPPPPPRDGRGAGEQKAAEGHRTQSARRRPWGAVVVAFLVGAAVAAAAVAVVTERARRSQDDRASRLVAERDDLAARNDILASRVDGLDRRVEGLERALARSRRRARLAARVAAPDEGRPGDVTVDLGGWDGLFRVDGTAVGFRDGVAEVGGVIEFLGGAPCPLGRIELTASFLAGGNSIASGVWQAPTLAEGEPAPFFIEAPASAVADEAEITMTDARCAS